MNPGNSTLISRTIENLRNLMNEEKINGKKKRRMPSVKLREVQSTKSATKNRLKKLGISESPYETESSIVEQRDTAKDNRTTTSAVRDTPDRNCQTNDDFESKPDALSDPKQSELDVSRLHETEAGDVTPKKADNPLLEEEKHKKELPDSKQTFKKRAAFSSLYKRNESSSESEDERNESKLSLNIINTAKCGDDSGCSSDEYSITRKRCFEVLDPNRGYFEIYMQQLYRNIIKRGGRHAEDEDARQQSYYTDREYRGQQLYYSDGEGTVFELFSPRSRLGYSDLDRRRRETSAKGYGDTPNYQKLDFHPITKSTRPASRLRLGGDTPTARHTPSALSGKVVRFFDNEAKNSYEKLWDDRVQALGQLTSQKLTKKRYQGSTKPKNRSYQNQYLRNLGNRSVLPPVRKSIHQDEFKNEECDNSPENSFTRLRQDMDRLRSFNNDHVTKPLTNKTEKRGVRASNVGKTNLAEYKKCKAEWRLGSFVGSENDLESLQEKKEKTAKRFEYGRLMREINRLNALKADLQRPLTKEPV